MWFVSLVLLTLHLASPLKARTSVRDPRDIPESHIAFHGIIRPSEQHKFVTEPNELILNHDVWAVMKRLEAVLSTTTTDLKEILSLQEQEFKLPLTGSSYKSSWNWAMDKAKQNSKKHNSTLPIQLHAAVFSYTYNIYTSFNLWTRNLITEQDIKNYPYKSFFRLLTMAIEGIKLDKRYQSNQLVHYRGIRVAIELKIGDLIAFQSFVSTSKLQSVANSFGSKTYFVFNGNVSDYSISVHDHTVFTGEHEVLLTPFNIYKVVDARVSSTGAPHYILERHFPVNKFDKVYMISED